MIFLFVLAAREMAELAEARHRPQDAHFYRQVAAELEATNSSYAPCTARGWESRPASVVGRQHNASHSVLLLLAGT